MNSQRGATYICGMCHKPFQITTAEGKIEASIFGPICPECTDKVMKWERDRLDRIEREK